MSETDTCPICLSDYTISDVHRPAALKCGHLFGNQCILAWFKDSRTGVCPTCAKPSRKSDIRIIFCSSVKCIDSVKENEITEKYLSEKNIKDKLAVENKHLKLTVNLLQSEIMKLEKNVYETKILDINNIYAIPEFYIVKKLSIKISYSILTIDKANENIFISFRSNKSLGYMKLDYNYEKFKFVGIFDAVPDCLFITEMKISMFFDSLLLMCYERTVALVNSITDNIIVCIKCDYKIRTVSFGNNKDCFYIGDEKGNFQVYNLKELKFILSLKIDNVINSIEIMNQIIFILTINNIYKLSFEDEKENIEKLEINQMSKYIYLSVYENYLFLTSREGVYKTTHTIYEYNQQEKKLKVSKIIKNVKQFIKYRNKIYKGKIFYIDETENSIYLLFINRKQRYLLYKGKDRIIDFDVTENSMAVLEERNFILLKETIIAIV